MVPTIFYSFFKVPKKVAEKFVVHIFQIICIVNPYLHKFLRGQYHLHQELELKKRKCKE